MQPTASTQYTPQQIMQLGQQAMQQGQLLQAFSCFEKLGEVDSSNSEAWMLSGIALQRMGKYQEAMQRFKRVLTLRPGYGHAMLNLGLCYEFLGETNAALQTYDEVLAQEPINLQAHKLRVKLLETLPDKADIAFAAIKQALEQFPNDGFFRIIEGKLLTRDNKPVAARESLEQAKAKSAADHGEQAMLYEAWGMLEELSGDYTKAFDAFEQSQRAASNHPAVKQIPKDIYYQLIERNAAFYTKERFDTWKDNAPVGGRSPCFLVGFPRSGTTLCEAIFDAHPAVATSQESPFLQGLVSEAATLAGRSIDDVPHFVDDLNPEHLNALQEQYWQRVHQRCPEAKDSKVFLDKLPLNIVELGFIQRLFPKASIIVALRDPRDVVLSCFKQLFRPNAAMVNFYTLEDTARFYAAVMGLWQHYQQVLSLAILPYHYETLVEDTETQAQSLLEHAGLDWRPEVLEFHRIKRNRQVRTPSYQGVSEPVYNRAVGGWKHYETQLEPVLPDLQPFIDAFGYQ